MFFLIADSDKNSPGDPLSEIKRQVIERVREKGGREFVWRKREIENYLHPKAIARVPKIDLPEIRDFSDVKQTITNLLQKEKSAEAEYLEEKHGLRVARAMTSDEILEMCRIEHNGSQRYEIVELFRTLLGCVLKPEPEAKLKTA
jgi:hypothetical protein